MKIDSESLCNSEDDSVWSKQSGYLSLVSASSWYTYGSSNFATLVAKFL